MGRVCIRLTAELSPTFWKARPSRSMGTEAKRALFASCQTSRRLLLIAVQQIAAILSASFESAFSARKARGGRWSTTKNTMMRRVPQSAQRPSCGRTVRRRGKECRSDRGSRFGRSFHHTSGRALVRCCRKAQDPGAGPALRQASLRSQEGRVELSPLVLA
jgi:hypothetical protein